MGVSFLDGLLSTAQKTSGLNARTWGALRRAFPGQAFDRWTEALERVAAVNSEPAVIQAFATGTSAVAQAHGVDVAMAAVQAALAIRKSAGASTLRYFFTSLPTVLVATRDSSSFRMWLRTIEEICNLAPESAELLLRQSASILEKLNVMAFRNWLLNGVRLSEGDPLLMLAYYSQADTDTMAVFERRAGDVTFVDAEKSLRAILMALWKLRPAIRTATIRPGGQAPLRSSFDGTFIRVPEVFAGYRGPEARAHYYAVMAHIGAHVVHTREKFLLGSLRPIQVALVGLVEDARAELLAATEYPGLKRLWMRFHTAEPAGTPTAELLMIRLSRALIDPAYSDDDPWVSKGRMMFFDYRGKWEDQSISRTIGSLLGNDLGQMRIQFNAKTYLAEPSYRDDNTGIWDFGDPPPEEAHAAETIIEARRINEKEESSNLDRRERDDSSNPQANMAAKVPAMHENAGVPIAKHGEWDHISGVLRHEWTTILEFQPQPAASATIDDVLEKYVDVKSRITRLVRAAKISHPVRQRWRPEGDRLDLEACIRATIERRSGRYPDTRIYETREMRARELSVLVLLDVSESTRDRVKDTAMSVLALERSAAALLAEAMSELGDPFAIHGFCSNGREEVRYYRVKDFAEPYTEVTRARLAGLRGMLSTRLGAALRQAGMEIENCATHRRLVLVITDGEPADVDVADTRYLVEDARKAVQELSHLGIDVFCVGLGSGGESYLPRIFGIRNFLMIDRIEALPEKLPMLYFRLTV